MSTSSQSVLTAFEQGVLTITLNRPKANAFNTEMSQAAQAAFKTAERDAAVRCVLLTGSGSFFSAGQDITEVKDEQEFSFRNHLQHTYHPLVLQIRKLEKPVLAALNGAVAGAALGIALACDLRMAADTARILVGFIGIGLVPDSAVSLLLPATIGLGRATEHIFTNRPINADEALSMGLVNRVVPAGELPERAAEWARSLAHGPLHAIGLSKRALNNALLGHLEQVLDYEAHLQEIAGRGAEHQEGLKAFLEKRPARFSDYS